MFRLMMILIIFPCKFVFAGTEEFVVGNWNGGATYDETTGQFNRCLMYADYEGGNVLAFGIGGDGAFHIVLRNEQWTLEIGSTYPVVLTIDNRFFGEFDAASNTGTGVSIEIPYTTRNVDMIRRGNMLVVETSGVNLYFALEGTYNGLSRLEQCFVRNFKKSSDAFNPFAEIAPSPVNPFSGKKQVKKDAPATEEGRETVELILLLAGLEDFRYAPPGSNEIFEDVNWGWTNDKIYGGLITSEKSGLNIQEATAGVHLILENSCDGELRVAVMDDMIADLPGKNFAAKCLMNDNVLEIIVVMLESTDIFLIMFNVSIEGNSGAVLNASEKMSDALELLLEDD